MKDKLIMIKFIQLQHIRYTFRRPVELKIIYDLDGEYWNVDFNNGYEFSGPIQMLPYYFGDDRDISRILDLAYLDFGREFDLALYPAGEEDGHISAANMERKDYLRDFVDVTDNLPF